MAHEFGDRKREYEALDEALLPQAKRAKIAGGAVDVQRAEETAAAEPRKVMPEFRAKTSDKPCPNYRISAEIGAFSFDEEDKFCLDRSQLRYYNPPSHTSRLSMDLKVGHDEYVPREGTGRPGYLEPILQCISVNGHCFKPRSEPLSPNNGSSVDTTTAAPNAAGPNERLDDPLTNFIAWRGILTNMLCSLYNHQEPWKVAATLYKGTIYLQELETEERRKSKASMSPQHKAYSYWGMKFEDYVTSKEPPPKAPPQSPRLAPGTVNNNCTFCSIVRTQMNTHSIVMAGEVDCCDHESNEKPPLNYIELKTSRTVRNKASLGRHKQMKWWAQSFLIGVPKLICGFRNDNGIVESLKSFRISDIPKETQAMWQPSVCLNFLDELLVWIRKTVTVDNPQVVYLLEWRAPYTCVQCEVFPEGSEHVFLPDWYVDKQHPPPPLPTADSPTTAATS